MATEADPVSIEGRRLGFALVAAALRRDHVAAGVLLESFERSVLTDALQTVVGFAAVTARRLPDVDAAGMLERALLQLDAPAKSEREGSDG